MEAIKSSLKHPINYWTEEQKNFLIKYYPTKGSIWVGERVIIQYIELQEIKKNYHEYIYNKCHVGKYIWILKDIEILENPIYAIGNTNIWEYDLQLIKEDNK